MKTENGTHIAGGTLFGDRYLRLVQLGEFRLDSYLDGILLVFPIVDGRFRNAHVPGHEVAGKIDRYVPDIAVEEGIRIFLTGGVALPPTVKL